MALCIFELFYSTFTHPRPTLALTSFGHSKKLSSTLSHTHAPLTPLRQRQIPSPSLPSRIPSFVLRASPLSFQFSAVSRKASISFTCHEPYPVAVDAAGLRPA